MVVHLHGCTTALKVPSQLRTSVFWHRYYCCLDGSHGEWSFVPSLQFNSQSFFNFIVVQDNSPSAEGLPTSVRVNPSFVHPILREQTGLQVGWLVGWLGGWLVGWVVGWLVGWVVGWSVGSLAGWLVGWLVGWLAGWLVG